MPPAWRLGQGPLRCAESPEADGPFSGISQVRARHDRQLPEPIVHDHTHFGSWSQRDAPPGN